MIDLDKYFQLERQVSVWDLLCSTRMWKLELLGANGFQDGLCWDEMIELCHQSKREGNERLEMTRKRQEKRKVRREPEFKRKAPQKKPRKGQRETRYGEGWEYDEGFFESREDARRA